jgi:hypothetical protein
MLLEYFTNGTESTKTGKFIGMEIETDFLNAEDGAPISIEVAKSILSATDGRPSICTQKLELGRQKIELSIAPQDSIGGLCGAAEESLDWLYKLARGLGAYPLHAPEIDWAGDLLWVQEERDALWVELDGRAALEELCRCSSVQFTVDVHPSDACTILNQLWQARLHQVDYAPNNGRWIEYIHRSRVNYRPSRYGGPAGFADLNEYAAALAVHPVLMQAGKPVNRPIHEVANVNIDLFLRSVWWHYRLRRFGSTLAVEIRPFARREDDQFEKLWKLITEATGL